MSTGNLKIFSERLVLARKKLFPTQFDLARVLEISGSTVGNWESGKNYPDTESLPEIQKALSVSLDWLFGISDNPVAKPGILEMELPNPLRTAAEQVVSSEGYSNIEELVRALLREKTGVGRISSVSPRVRTAALQLVELAAQTISIGGGKPESGPQLIPEGQLVQNIQE